MPPMALSSSFKDGPVIGLPQIAQFKTSARMSGVGSKKSRQITASFVFISTFKFSRHTVLSTRVDHVFTANFSVFRANFLIGLERKRTTGGEIGAGGGGKEVGFFRRARGTRSGARLCPKDQPQHVGS